MRLTSIMCLLLLISCSKPPGKNEQIFNYIESRKIPTDAKLYIANGLGCYYCNYQLIKHFYHTLKNDASCFLITCNPSYFDKELQDQIKAIENKYVDSTNFIARLDVGTYSPAIVRLVGKDSIRVVGINVQNCESLLNY